MSIPAEFESILVVFQNPVPGRVEPYDDWYTNIHIRDAMRLRGAIATQRFAASADQVRLNGAAVVANHWAHTIYEWESAQQSVDGHNERAGTPLMEISRDGTFEGLLDYYYRPVFLSHGWSREAGFRRGTDVLTAMIIPAGDDFVAWFKERHVPETLALPGFASVGLFSLHEAQSLQAPCRYPLVAIYSLSDRVAALAAWSARADAGGDGDLALHAVEVEATCHEPRIARLLARDVADPSPEAAAEERRARGLYAGNYVSQAELSALILG